MDAAWLCGGSSISDSARTSTSSSRCVKRHPVQICRGRDFTTGYAIDRPNPGRLGHNSTLTEAQNLALSVYTSDRTFATHTRAIASPLATRSCVTCVASTVYVAVLRTVWCDSLLMGRLDFCTQTRLLLRKRHFNARTGQPPQLGDLPAIMLISQSLRTLL